MEIIYGQTFRGETISIDNKTFIECALSDCVLEYSGCPVAFEQTQIERCRYVFFSEAQTTVKFLLCVGLLREPSEWGEPKEPVN